MDNSFELTLFFICIFLSGFYSGSEAALVSITIDRAKQLLEGGGKRGLAMKFLVNEPTTVLTTLLVGNNLVNILAASLITVIAQDYFLNDAVAVATGVTTFIILIFGEIIPKTLARKHAETLAYPITKIIQMNYYLLYPLIKPITILIHIVLGDNADLKGRIVTSNDIEFMVSQAEKGKTIDSKQIDLLNSILEFPTIKVKDIIVHRKEVRYLRGDARFEEVINYIKDNGHSRYPVVTEDLDDSIGFLHVKDLAFVSQENLNDFDLKTYVKPPFYVYEHMKIQAVFDHMNRKKVHLALVKDENGMVVGIITLEDIVEEILGEIIDEHDIEGEDFIDTNGSSLEEGITVEGSISLRDFDNDYDVKIPLNDNYSTLAGFILEMLGNNFPEEGQLIVWEGYGFTVDTVEDQEIKKISVKVIQGAPIIDQSDRDDNDD